MVKITDKIKMHYRHKSLYDISVEALLSLRKKKYEQSWIESFNAIIASFTGIVAFVYGYQHLSIIFVITALLMVIYASFTSNYVEQIDMAIFLKEKTME